jgi:hypothetical protein
MLPHRAYEIGQMPSNLSEYRIAEENCCAISRKRPAPLLERPRPHILTAQHQQIESVEHNFCGFVASALQKAE